MLELLVTLVTGNVGANLRRVARLAAFASLTAAFAMVALLAAVAAAFLALDAALGPVKAALIIAAGAAMIAFLPSIPLSRSRNRRRPWPPRRWLNWLSLSGSASLLSGERKKTAREGAAFA